jgi:hypothetical protein
LVTRKSRISSDPSLATSHDAGAKVVRVQISEHDSLGTIFYRIGRHWVWHWKAAVEARSDLGRLHNQIELLPLDRNNTRFVYANETVSEHE